MLKYLFLRWLLYYSLHKIEIDQGKMRRSFRYGRGPGKCAEDGIDAAANSTTARVV
jgi:hypothetical protein